ncbi:MAG: hypothetical protein CMA10_04530 [Euryarchaeota archaeon]|nr:hypothetical protein [Euryarchaeota archaeon]
MGKAQNAGLEPGGALAAGAAVKAPVAGAAPVARLWMWVEREIPPVGRSIYIVGPSPGGL